MRGKGVLSEALRSLNQATDRSHIRTQLELSRAEHSTLDLHHVLITVDHTIHRHIITILQIEGSHLELTHIMH